jgi:hypothetical protein
MKTITAGSTLWLLSALLTLSTCARDEKFEDIAQNIAGPIDLSLSADESTVYVLNADIDRRFNSGSILMLDADGNKLGHTKTPRLGRFLARIGNALIVGFDRDSNDEKVFPKLHIYDVSNPASPVLAKEFDLECTPVNAVGRENYKHFAVTCINSRLPSNRGQLYIGTFGEGGLQDSQIKLVRKYNQTRRAMYIDPDRKLLFMFPTDMDRQESRDLGPDERQTSTDQKTVTLTYTQQSASSATTAEDVITDGPNEVPDSFELTNAARLKRGARRAFQFIVYNIEKESSAEPEAFPFRSDDNILSESEAVEYPRVYKEGRATADQAIISGEHRWLYFNLRDFDGTPDLGDKFLANQYLKFYRTNFWEAKADPLDADAFLISQRQAPGDFYNYSNNIIRVRIVGDARTNSETGNAPITSDYLDFERVYGFRGETTEGTVAEIDEKDSRSFPGDFEMQIVKGRPLLVVNHFRDLDSFESKFRGFALTAKTLDGDLWVASKSETDPKSSFYQVVLTSKGVGFSSSFYGQSVIRFEVEPGVDITSFKPFSN